jgi:branched-chain amino acid transport system ATP-binding protein
MPLLQTCKLTAFYGDFQALYGIDASLDVGETIAIIGANGAGKSTFLKAIAGLIPGPADSVLLDGQPIGSRPAADIVRLGVALVPEGRRLFPSLTVEENLLIGGYGRKIPGPWTLDRVYSLFPILKERRASATPTLSGGQQQMAAIGRALMSNPKLLLCDEISLGLAPIVVREIYARLPSLLAQGLSMIIVEQDIVQALKAASHVYCLQEGRVALEGAASGLTREAISTAYFGV